VESFVAAWPARVRLVVCSRWDSLPALNRFRAEGRLHEIRADQLRFTVNETGAFLQRVGLPLSRTHLVEIQAGTRGWPAGVRLIGAALRSRTDPDEFLERFAAHEGLVADFLVGEVLDGLPAADREVLSAISIAEPATAEVAAAITGRSDTRAILDRLARDTGLVASVSAPADAYQVHPMVTAHLTGDPPLRPCGDRTSRHPILCLDDTERHVLALLPSSMSVEEIAHELGFPATEQLRAQMHAIYRKLGASSRRTAVTAARDEGLLG
jgi:LuxR family maltose regulon positive regulatory protein